MKAAVEFALTPTRRAALRRLYGLEESDLLALLDIVDHRCPVCLRPFKAARVPCVDHAHDTGLIFGPLDQRCNLDLFGVFGRDPEFYERAAAFLRHPPAARLPGPRRRVPDSAPVTKG